MLIRSLNFYFSCLQTDFIFEFYLFKLILSFVKSKFCKDFSSFELLNVSYFV